MLPVRFQPEESAFTLRFADDRPADIHHVIQSSDVDRPVDSESRPRRRRQSALEPGFDGDESIHRGWVDPSDLAAYGTLPRIDRNVLANHHFPYSRLRDFQ